MGRQDVDFKLMANVSVGSASQPSLLDRIARIGDIRQLLHRIALNDGRRGGDPRPDISIDAPR
jgi:hypothetical protein